MTLKQKKLERGNLVNKMRAITDKAAAESRDFTDEENSSYTNHESDFDRLTNEIDREERQLSREAQLGNTPQNSNTPAPRTQAQNGDQPTNEDSERQQRYSNAFFAYARRGRAGMEAMENGGQFVNALQVGTDTEGGYLVPEEWERQLIKELPALSVMRRLAKVLTAGTDKNIPVRGNKAQFGWIDEEGTYPKVDPSYGNVKLGAHKLGGIILVSEELLQDNDYNLESELRMDSNEEFGEREEEAFMIGDGVGKPQGIFTTTAVAGKSLVGKTAASTTLVTYDELIELEHTLKRKYRRGAMYFMSDDTVLKIRKLKDNDGQYIWKDGTNGEPPTLNGYPVEISDFAPNASAGAKSIMFGNPRYYTVVDRLGMTMQRLNELYAENGQIGFKATRRVEGKLTLAESFTFLQQAAS